MKSKKLLSLILAVLMLSTVLLSCSDNNSGDASETKNQPSVDSGETETEAETEEELTDGLGNPDFGGYTFRILSSMFGNDYGANRIMYDELTGNPVTDELYASRAYIEDRFKIKYESIEMNDITDVQTAVKTSVNAGDDSFDIVINHDGITFGLVKEGMFCNMFDVEQFDFDKPWWPDNTVNALSICDNLYCASSYISYLGLHWARAMIINKDYAQELNIEIPYDLVREGKWTTDALLSMVEGNSQDLDGNGIFDTSDKVAFVTGRETFYCLQESQECSAYRHDDNDVPYLDINVEKIDAYVQKWRSLINSNDYVVSDDGFGENTFKNGTNLICLGEIGDAYDIYRNTDMRYGFLPTPKFDEYQENYINSCTDLPWAIPKTVKAEQLSIIGTVCEAISCYNYKNVLPAYFEVAMKSRVADSPDDAEMLQIIADTRTIGFAHAYGLPLYNILGDLGSSNREVASYIKSIQKIADKNLSRLIETFESMGES